MRSVFRWTALGGALLLVAGTGANIYNNPFPGPAAGATPFTFHYKGQVCLP